MTSQFQRTATASNSIDVKDTKVRHRKDQRDQSVLIGVIPEEGKLIIDSNLEIDEQFF